MFIAVLFMLRKTRNNSNAPEQDKQNVPYPYN